MASVIKDSQNIHLVDHGARVASTSRVTVTKIGKQDIVVVAALRISDNSDRLANVVGLFIESCDRAFRAARARISSEVVGRKHSRIASFRRSTVAPASAMNAAVRLHMELAEAPQEVRYVTAIGRGIDATIELIDNATDGQIVFDPSLYPGLNVHPPVTGFELRTEIQKMSALIPWYDLSDDECVLCVDDPFDEEG